MPSTALLDGLDLTDVLEVTSTVSRDQTANGRPSSLCNTVAFTIVRECVNSADAKLFELFANNDGTRRLFDGQIEHIDERNRTLIAYRFERGFLSSYCLTNGGPDGRAKEIVTVRSGIVTQTSGGEDAPLRHETYIENTND